MKTITELVAIYHACRPELVKTGRRMTAVEQAGNFLAQGYGTKTGALRAVAFQRQLMGEELFTKHAHLVGAEKILEELP